MPVSSYSSRTAPSSKLSPGWRRPAGGSQVPVGRWSRSMRPSSLTGRRPETRSALKARPQRRCSLCPPRGKYMARRGGSHVGALREAPYRRSAAAAGEDVQASGEVEDRPGLWQLQAYLPGHLERTHFGLRRLQGPQPVMDLAAANQALLVRAVKAVALGQEVLDGPRTTLERLSRRAVAGLELGGRGAPVRAEAPVVDLVVRGMAGDPGVESKAGGSGVGEADGEATVGVQGEEPDAGFAFRRP